MVTKYQKRISGPLLDRIDTARRIEVPRVDYEKLSGDRISESSESIRTRVQAARNIQQTRFTNPNSPIADIICNADMRVGEVRQFCQLQACPEQGRRDEGAALPSRTGVPPLIAARTVSVSKCKSLMRSAMTQLNLSARAYHRILKLARTIADLAGSEEIQSVHLAEALHLRSAEDYDGIDEFFYLTFYWVDHEIAPAVTEAISFIYPLSARGDRQRRGGQYGMFPLR